MKKAALICAILLLSQAAWAQGEVVINEVAWSGSGASSNDEFIELYNTTAAPIDLNGFYIHDDEGYGSPSDTTYIFSSSACNPGECYTCANNDCTIPANGYFLIEKNEDAVKDVAANLVIADLSLGNTGDSLAIKDGSDTVIDFLDCASQIYGWYAGVNNSNPDQDFTMERISPTIAGDFSLNWATNDPQIAQNGIDSGDNAINGTPGQENSRFGETIPGPEIVNVHCVDSTAVDVYFNVVLDQTSAELIANYVLNAGAADINPAAALLDGSDATLVHLTGLAGISPLDLTDLTVSDVLDAYLAGQPSNSSASFYFGVIEIASARQDADANGVPDIIEQTPDAFVTVQGIVTSADVFYYLDSTIQDTSGGLTIKDAMTTGQVTRGDDIRVSGTFDQYHNWDYFENTKFVLISQANEVEPMIMTLADLITNPEPYESMLLGVATVTNTGSGDTWPVSGSNASVQITDDAGTSVYVFQIDRDTDVDGSAEPTWPVIVAGIGGQYDDTYQILPRDLGDIDIDDQNWPPEGATQPCYTPAATASILQPM
ncbi:MAG: lamin tail domain-containing protein [Deltaproteobacteria bacterium]|nr:lamin tail domain-containing protein [Deltaproteobacteria bacterium]